jgi:hypothetical protein
VWPLRPQPEVVAVFDRPAGPYAAGHRGVDLAGAVGQPVLAVAAGEVSFTGQVAGRGIVVVDHGRLRTTYEPVRPLVRPGEAVAAGEVVGTLAVFGSHCLPSACLHLGVRDGADYLDPLDFLTTGPIRLLPVVPLDASGQVAATVPPPLAVARVHPPPLLARGHSTLLMERVLPPPLRHPLMPPLATGFMPLLR